MKVLQFAGTAISAVALAVLQNATCADNTVKLNSGQLSRPVYEEVNEVLERLGGKWKGGRTAAHIFPYDPSLLLAQVIENRAMPDKNPLAYFPTPPAVCEVLFRQALLKLAGRSPRRILEPSAGTGELADDARALFPSATLDVVEIDEFRASILKRKGYDPFVQDFLQFRPNDRYDLIVANPPFSVEGDANAYITHTLYMWSLLAEDGVLCVVAPPGFTYQSRRKAMEFKLWVEKYGSWEFLPDQAFKESGTNIKTVLIVLKKSQPQPLEVEPETIDVVAVDREALDKLLNLPLKSEEREFEHAVDDADDDTVAAAIAQLTNTIAERKAQKLKKAELTPLERRLKLLTEESNYRQQAAAREAQWQAMREHLKESIEPYVEQEDWQRARAEGIDDGDLIQLIIKTYAQVEHDADRAWNVTKKPSFQSTVNGRTLEKDFLAGEIRRTFNIPHRPLGEGFREIAELEIKSSKTQDDLMKSMMKYGIIDPEELPARPIDLTIDGAEFAKLKYAVEQVTAEGRSDVILMNSDRFKFYLAIQVQN